MVVTFPGVSRSDGTRHPVGVRTKVIVAAVAAALVAAATATVAVAHRNAPPLHVPGLGVYAGPGAKGVAGAAKFGALTGTTPSEVLDFAQGKDWAGITGPDWLLHAHAGRSARLEYSLPMMPDGSNYSLSACAAGSYDDHWRALATNLVGAELADAIVRPGWEFNGNWYHWSAQGHVGAYVGCFRHIVDTMRLVPGQRFAFDWNPTLGPGKFPADQAYPGDSYVDYIGLDAYDTSWTHYSHGHHATSDRAKAWHDDLHGDHGLDFWSKFAATHHKPLAITEWGLTQLSNGHGGGDDPAYVDHMVSFMTNANHHVAYEHYFDTGSSDNDHLLGPGTAFPRGQAELKARLSALSAVSARAAA